MFKENKIKFMKTFRIESYLRRLENFVEEFFFQNFENNQR